MSNRLLRRMGGTEPPYDHRASDDLESLFYIFFEFVIVYGGPEGDRTDAGVLPLGATAWRKAYATFGHDGVWATGALKEHFITDSDPTYQVAPYFRDCSSMVEGWRKTTGSAIHAEMDVTHDEIIELIDQCLRSITGMQMDRTLSPNAHPPSSSCSMIEGPRTTSPKVASSSLSVPISLPPPSSLTPYKQTDGGPQASSRT